MKNTHQKNISIALVISSLFLASSMVSFIGSNLSSSKSLASEINAIAENIGPSTLPEWYVDAQVQLGWVFDDPLNPQYSTPLPGWDKAIGEVPTWSYDPDRIVFGHLGQWYIRIPNLVNDHPSKKFWISWIYEFDTYIEGVRSATNIDWSPSGDLNNAQYNEVWLDSDGIITTDYLKATHAQVTHSFDIYPNPEYEDVWLGVYGGSKHALEVYIITLCEEKSEPEPVEIGPGTLPEWHADAQVQLGWIFNDPMNPQDSNPLPGWDQAIGEIPTWSYDPDRVIFDQPAQWFIRIPNLINDHPSKKVWLSWVYEYDNSLTGQQIATNIDWYPNTGMENPQYLEEWFDSDGNSTINPLEAVYGRITASVDLYPNPQYEDIWLGVYGESQNILEVYLKTLCVEEIEPEPKETDVLIDVKLNLSSNDESSLKIVVKLSSGSTEIRVLVKITSSNEDPEVKVDLDLLGSFFDLDTSLDIIQSGSSTAIRIKLRMKLVVDSNEEFKTSIDAFLNGSFTNLDIEIDVELNGTPS